MRIKKRKVGDDYCIRLALTGWGTTGLISLLPEVLSFYTGKDGI